MNPSSPLLQRGQSIWQTFTDLLDSLRPAAALSARLYLAQVFFLAGLTKVRDWDITLLLFTEEYNVPLLSPEVAAVLGTAGSASGSAAAGSSVSAGSPSSSCALAPAGNAAVIRSKTYNEREAIGPAVWQARLNRQPV